MFTFGGFNGTDYFDTIGYSNIVSLDPTLAPSIIPTQPSRGPSMQPSNEPTVIPTRPTIPPSNVPSHNPSWSPSREPTHSPSALPSDNPTLAPTLPTSGPTREPSVPTSNPTANPTTEPNTNEIIQTGFNTSTSIYSSTTASSTSMSDNNETLSGISNGGGDDGDSSSLSDIDWNNISVTFTIICAACTVVIIICGLGHYKVIASSAIDTVAIVAIIRFGGDIADFGSDILFTFALFDEKSEYGIYCAIFTLLPYFVSCIVGIYWLERWRSRTDERLLVYLNKYDKFVIIGTVVAGFYSTILLSQSKLFALTIFNFQLKKSDIQTLENYKFFNYILLENIPQLIIQQLYIFTNESSDINDVVYIALTFTCLSLIAAFLRQASRLCQQRRKRNLKFLYNDVLTCKLTMDCVNLKSYHPCSRLRIQECLIACLRVSPQLKQLHHRLDTSISIEVYNIENNIKLLKSMIVTFDVNILTNHNDNESMTNVIRQNIVTMGVRHEFNYQTLQRTLKNALKLKDISSVALEMEIIRSQSVNLMDKNQIGLGKLNIKNNNMKNNNNNNNTSHNNNNDNNTNENDIQYKLNSATTIKTPNGTDDQFLNEIEMEGVAVDPKIENHGRVKSTSVSLENQDRKSNGNATVKNIL